MGHTILLYGATGYSGRLIAFEAARLGMTDDGQSGYRMVLAGRDGRAVGALAKRLGMESRVFGLENRPAVIRALRAADADVVINAAGPFALTADHLAKGALAAGCHYVDINGEADVYLRLDDLGVHARRRGLAIVSGAGHTPAASNLLLHAALQELRLEAGSGDDAPELSDDNPREDIELGDVRLAMSRPVLLSRGSLETLARSLREQVIVVRWADVENPSTGGLRKQPVLWHEPLGKLERTFDFFDAADVPLPHGPKRRDLRIAAAANLVDTLTARLTLHRHRFWAHRIESYVEVGTVSRLAYQVGPLLAPFLTTPWARDLIRLQLNAFPVGPTRAEREASPHLVVLEIDDRFQNRILEWAWHTPNPYTFTARIVVKIATRVAAGTFIGWRTPAEVLRPASAALTASRGPFRGCSLDVRHRVALESAS